MAGTGCSVHVQCVAGCDGCKRLSRLYDRRRRALIANGTWQRPVAAAEVQAHIDRLRGNGMSIAGIARAAQVADRTVRGVRKRNFVYGPTATAILAVGEVRETLPAGKVTAVGATRRVQALTALGWSLTAQAREIGMHVQQVWEIAWGRQEAVSVTTHAKLDVLFERLSATPGPSVRARNAASRHGWVPPLAWGDDLDNPNAAPDLGDDVREAVDEVAVQRALAGERVRLTDRERLAALQTGLGHGQTLATVARVLRLNYGTACALVGVDPGRGQDVAGLDAEIQRLAEFGHGQYAISALTGVHRRTVGRALARIADKQELQQVAS